MKWNYKCPVCGLWEEIDWGNRGEMVACRSKKILYTPPEPKEQHEAYVDTGIWPGEIEELVIRYKGNKCSEKGCNKQYETLDHRVPFTKNGKTSVYNLFPICNEHNNLKGDMDYSSWLLLKIIREL